MLSKFFRPPLKQAIILKNLRCAYCGDELTSETATRDHVIGRRFVPKGKLKAQWNLILNACRECNNQKSDLEDDIAAITLLPDLLGKFPHDDATAMAEAERRATGSISRRTRKPVLHSNEELKVEGNLGPGLKATFGLVAPPQIDQSRAFELARLHLTAFFFLQTYNPDTKQGGWWLHGFHPTAMAHKDDWGNATMRGFMTATRDWECRFHGVTADGFFKVIIRRHPNNESWGWALEYNQSLRLIGFFGEREPAQKTVESFPPAQFKTLYQSSKEWLRMRVEIPLSESDDTLFCAIPESCQHLEGEA